MDAIVLAVTMLVPLTMVFAARHLRRGRISLHPHHAHAVVLATRYLVAGMALCFGTPAVLAAVFMGGSWAPVAAVVLAAGATFAWLRGSERGRDADLEPWVHLVFGGLAGVLALATGVLLAQMGALMAGATTTPIGAGLGAMVLANMGVQALAYAVFCFPLTATRGLTPPPLPSVPDFDAWVDAIDLGAALQTDESPR